VNLKFTFRRTVNSQTMSKWLEILQIAESLQFSDEKDVVIWQLSSNGKYSVQTLYAVVAEGLDRCSPQ
jgi:hypothetical protein